MTDLNTPFDYDSLKSTGTGSLSLTDETRIIQASFDRYELKIRLTDNNEFLEIIEIKVSKNFLNYKQKISKKGYIDIGDLYLD